MRKIGLCNFLRQPKLYPTAPLHMDGPFFSQNLEELVTHEFYYMGVFAPHDSEVLDLDQFPHGNGIIHYGQMIQSEYFDFPFGKETVDDFASIAERFKPVLPDVDRVIEKGVEEINNQSELGFIWYSGEDVKLAEAVYYQAYEAIMEKIRSVIENRKKAMVDPADDWEDTFEVSTSVFKFIEREQTDGDGDYVIWGTLPLTHAKLSKWGIERFGDLIAAIKAAEPDTPQQLIANLLRGETELIDPYTPVIVKASEWDENEGPEIIRVFKSGPESSHSP